MNKKVICLLGPTATGKTETALHIANHLPIQIISVDSAMIYQDMDIGTAKPSAEILTRYPHALVDICSPLDRYSAAEFRKDATEQIEKAFKKNKTPLLVGGTFLYFQSLLEGISPIPSVNSDIEKELNLKIEQVGLASLHHELLNVDPESAQRINPNDTQRILRALAVFKSTGKTLSYYWSLPKKASLQYPTLKLALANPDIEKQNEQIANRYHTMIKEGLIEEVIALLKKYPELTLDYPSLRAVGYRQIWEYLCQQRTLNNAIELAIIATRQYAKRQRTWLRSEKDLITISIASPDFKNTILKEVSLFLEE